LEYEKLPLVKIRSSLLRKSALTNKIFYQTQFVLS
jgi:hypothetical protein